MHNRNWVTALLLSLLMSAAWAGELLKIPLQWLPTTELGNYDTVDLTGLGNTRLQMGTFVEDRKSPQLIGQNWEDVDEMPADADEILPVTTRDSVAAWCRQHIGETLAAFGVRTVGKGGNAILSGKVRKFFVKEVNTYKASIGIFLTLSRPNGEVLWQGMLLGSEWRFGSSYEAENYYNVLSDALQNGTHKLLANAGFRAALRKAAAQ